METRNVEIVTNNLGIKSDYYTNEIKPLNDQFLCEVKNENQIKESINRKIEALSNMLLSESQNNF